ncbi:hypothetical protein, partial [Escherichia coli]
NNPFYKFICKIIAYATIHTNYGLQRLAQAKKGVDEKTSTFLRYEIQVSPDNIRKKGPIGPFFTSMIHIKRKRPAGRFCH